ncbi:MAG: hypothetical protein U5Q03_17985 [Bacteroidota bacterium]|nr:hypothetical protein [Bacteroidota bacterium]
MNIFLKISVYDGNNLLYSGMLKVWDSSILMFTSQNHTFIGDGYMPLPDSGSNININISISYGIYKWYNGSTGTLNSYNYKKYFYDEKISFLYFCIALIYLNSCAQEENPKDKNVKGFEGGIIKETSKKDSSSDIPDFP